MFSTIYYSTPDIHLAILLRYIYSTSNLVACSIDSRSPSLFTVYSTHVTYYTSNSIYSTEYALVLMTSTLCTLYSNLLSISLSSLL